MSRRREPTPNYNIMFESAVSALQNAYSEYKKAKAEELRWTFFNHDGRFCFYAGYEERKKRTENAEKEVARLSQIVNELRERREP